MVLFSLIYPRFPHHPQKIPKMAVIISSTHKKKTSPDKSNALVQVTFHLRNPPHSQKYHDSRHTPHDFHPNIPDLYRKDNKMNHMCSNLNRGDSKSVYIVSESDMGICNCIESIPNCTVSISICIETITKSNVGITI